MAAGLIDLHTHSTVSDGSLEPEELVAAAQEAGLTALALTDHDTTGGLDRALAAGERVGLLVVPGVEIAVKGGPTGSFHMVGLFIDQHHPDLVRGLAQLQAARARRNPLMIAKLRELGLDISLERVTELAGGGQVGRPHMALALLEAGHVRNTEQAFGRYLGQGRPAYVPKAMLDPAQAIAMFRGAGGVSVLAHPGIHGWRPLVLARLVEELKALGLGGLEVYYPEHTPEQTDRLNRLAARLDLAPSGGSDFHGAAKPAIALGVGRGDLAVPPWVLADLRRRAGRAN